MEVGEKEVIRQAVRNRYGQIANMGATENGSVTMDACCGNLTGEKGGRKEVSSCCGQNQITPEQIAAAIGYSEDDLMGIHQGTNMGLGCGNPVALASLKTGETVVDLGSGGGFDCFLAAKQVGKSGMIIGVDMTLEMISKARKNAEKMGVTNVDFRLGEIENLPIDENSADIIMSNCVINLSPDKKRVFQEAFRVLRPGGRLAISDILSTAELPEEFRKNLSLVAACIGGAITIEKIETILQEVGFQKIRITPKEETREHVRKWLPDTNVADLIVSAYIEAIKPGRS